MNIFRDRTDEPVERIVRDLIVGAIGNAFFGVLAGLCLGAGLSGGRVAEPCWPVVAYASLPAVFALLGFFAMRHTTHILIARFNLRNEESNGKIMTDSQQPDGAATQ